MTSLYDFGMDLVDIRNTLNALEVKGAQNASLLVHACEKCNQMINTINEVSKELAKNQNDTKDGDDDAELG